MSDSVRQLIINKIDARLKTILVTNGYATNIGQSVYDWRAESLEEANLPALIYRDTSTTTEISTLASFTHTMPVYLLAVVASDTPMSIIRSIIADIDKAIGTITDGYPGESWSGLALLTQRMGDESGVEIDEKKYAGCQMTMMVTFRTRGWDDYTQI